MGVDGILEIEGVEVTPILEHVMNREENYPGVKLIENRIEYPIIDKPSICQVVDALLEPYSVLIGDEVVKGIDFFDEYGYLLVSNDPLVTSKAINIATLDVSSLSPEKIISLKSDFEYFRQHPRLPTLDNFCSNIWNYHPDTSEIAKGTQIELYNQAIVEMNKPVFGKASGLIICGDNGVGKSHIAVALAKWLKFYNDMEPHYHFATEEMNKMDDVRSGQTWVLDDLNTLAPGAKERLLLDDLLFFGHDNGGIRVYITSNQNSNELINEYLSGRISEGEKKMYHERLRIMFQFIDIKGRSYRDRQK